ncbi:putative lactose operon transcription activator [Vibrio phage phiKT1028]|nr:putative lactose operon transcription activator [Vibrio phage phiKT1028]
MQQDFKQSLLESTVQWVHNNYHRPIKVGDIHHQMGLSAPLVTYLFKARFKITPGTYLRNYRMMKAHEHIRQGVKPTVACERTGYTSYHAFCRVYKVHYGLTPSEHSRRFRNMEVQTESYANSIMNKEFPESLRARIIDYVVENIKHNQNLRKLEKHFNLRFGSLGPMFEYFYNLTYYDWRKKMRMEKVNELIRNDPHMDLKSLPATLGICSYHYLNTLYQAHYGMTIGQYAYKQKRMV